MSAFFIAINRQGQPFERTLAVTMLAQLERYGHDGSELLVQGAFAIGHQRHWTVPEEQGERQPLYHPQADLWLVFHGRIDNRDELFSEFAPRVAHTISDAGLLMALYTKQGAMVLERIIGPFVFVFYSPSKQELVAARDTMGGRYLVYKICPEVILLATYEMALVAHPQVAYKLNKVKSARLLINSMDAVPLSLIDGLTPLFPGQLLRCEGRTQRLETFYLPDPNKRVRLADNHEYALEFKRLLNQSVKRRLRRIKPVGSMLSGGFDSVPMSICAAQTLALENEKLTTFSWVFDRTPEADERKYSMPVSEAYGMQAQWVNCDDVWPRFDATTHTNPIVPFSTPYSAYAQSLFATAREQKIGVLLSGMGGDMLYSGTNYLLRELAISGRFTECWAEAKLLYSAMPNWRTLVREFLIDAIRKPVKTGRQAPVWLHDKLAARISQDESFLASKQRHSLRPQQYFNVLGSLEGEDAAYGRYLETSYGVERRYPYRDRNLAEFMLAIPADQLFAGLIDRPIVRNAFSNELPLAMLERKEKTNFTAAINAGLAADKNYRSWLTRDNPAWEAFVKKRYIASNKSDKEGVSALQWRCAYHEFWKTVCYNPYAQKLG